jgi:hypothetical protein
MRFCGTGVVDEGGAVVSGMRLQMKNESEKPVSPRRAAERFFYV